MKLSQERELETRFPHVLEALAQVSRDGHQAEAEMARQMIFGRRPNVEQKYDALLMKLDRSYHRLLDHRSFHEKYLDSPLYKTRVFAKVRVKILGYVMSELSWMKARNRDLIEIRNEAKNRTEKSEGE